MSDLPPKPDDKPDDWRPTLNPRLLDVDARVDSFVFQTGRLLREVYERYSTFMDRFHASGWRRGLVEVTSEGATLGAFGLVLMFALALPAFQETSDDDWLKKSELAMTVLDRYGNEVGSRGIKHNDSIPLDQFPDHLIKAVLATEDRRFYEHFGIDIPGTVRALLINARAGGVVQGGSSVSQQLAKNLFLNNERTIERKVKEAFLAVWLETRLTKNEILKLYLDRAYMGGGAFGVDAAAHYYFNKSARDVNLAEAAMLAGLFKAPTRFAPHVNLPAARARANIVLDNLVEANFMTEGQVFGARRNPASAVDRRDERSPNYYLDWAYDEMRKLVDTFPKSMTERVFIVRTALDVSLQHEAENAVENTLRQHGKEYGASQAGAVIMEVDGAVRAMVGGRDYGVSQFNRTTDALRQPGSSFKPYVYAAALMTGKLKPTSTVVDSPVCIGTWCPRNYNNGYRGSMTLTQALTQSINTIAVKLATVAGNDNNKAGRAKIIQLAKAMGLRTPLPDSTSLPIGAAEVTILDHTGAFATFPNSGKAVVPHAVLEVRGGNGEVVWRFDRDGRKPRQVMPEQVAKDMVFMMNSAVENGTGKRAQLDGIKVAGKTGTTNAFRDAWFVGFTGNYVGGVWLGNDDYQSTKRMTGGTLPAQTWQQIMAFAHQGIELKPLIGAAPTPPPPRPAAAVVANATLPSARPVLLTKNAATILVRVERMMDAARAALPPMKLSSIDGGSPVTLGNGPLASASARGPGVVQGN